VVIVTVKKKPARILAIVGDRIGANCMMAGKKLSILDRFKHYGWDVTLSGVTNPVLPCPFAAQHGAESVSLDCTLDGIKDVSAFDAISILPGTSHRGLIESEHVMGLIRAAWDQGLVVSGWCRGVRALAAAGVLRGKQVVGHADDREAIEASGGVFLGQDHPPVIDGRLVTGARSYYYRTKNADAIKQAVQANRP
jgi:putative intracellular protease/amidase